jgi:hypothetical protein
VPISKNTLTVTINNNSAECLEVFVAHLLRSENVQKLTTLLSELKATNKSEYNKLLHFIIAYCQLDTPASKLRLDSYVQLIAQLLIPMSDNATSSSEQTDNTRDIKYWLSPLLTPGKPTQFIALLTEMDRINGPACRNLMIRLGAPELTAPFSEEQCDELFTTLCADRLAKEIIRVQTQSLPYVILSLLRKDDLTLIMRLLEKVKSIDAMAYAGITTQLLKLNISLTENELLIYMRLNAQLLISSTNTVQEDGNVILVLLRTHGAEFITKLLAEIKTKHVDTHIRLTSTLAAHHQLTGALEENRIIITLSIHLLLLSGSSNDNQAALLGRTFLKTHSLVIAAHFLAEIKRRDTHLQTDLIYFLKRHHQFELLTTTDEITDSHIQLARLVYAIRIMDKPAVENLLQPTLESAQALLLLSELESYNQKIYEKLIFLLIAPALAHPDFSQNSHFNYLTLAAYCLIRATNSNNLSDAEDLLLPLLDTGNIDRFYELLALVKQHDQVAHQKFMTHIAPILKKSLLICLLKAASMQDDPVAYIKEKTETATPMHQILSPKLSWGLRYSSLYTSVDGKTGSTLKVLDQLCNDLTSSCEDQQAKKAKLELILHRLVHIRFSIYSTSAQLKQGMVVASKDDAIQRASVTSLPGAN